MAHDKNYYASEFHKYSIHRTEKGIRIDINFQPLGEALDRAQLALDNQVWDDMKQYMPMRSGRLISDTNTLNEVSAGSGEVYVYDPTLVYSHFLYEGRTMVDPVTGIPWARKDTTKIYVSEFNKKKEEEANNSGAPWRKAGAKEFLQFSQPGATRHWDDVAIDKHMDQWVDVVRKTLEGSEI